eukprot:6123106-Prymnesium_polylepis.2
MSTPPAAAAGCRARALRRRQRGFLGRARAACAASRRHGHRSTRQLRSRQLCARLGARGGPAERARLPARAREADRSREGRWPLVALPQDLLRERGLDALVLL